MANAQGLTKADLTTYAAKVKALEGGDVTPGLTFAQSAARLTRLILAEGWQRPDDRNVALSLVLRLALLTWHSPVNAALHLDEQEACQLPPRSTAVASRLPVTDTLAIDRNNAAPPRWTG
jgi:hypothetical protein